MGAQSKFPTSGTPGSGGSGFYQNALNQQKQAVANVPATQVAQNRPNTPPNRPVSPPGQQPSAPGEDTRYLDAYNTYMQQQAGGSQYPPAQASPFGQSQPPAPQPQQPAMGRRPVRPQEQPPASPRGITMRAGYANRPFG